MNVSFLQELLVGVAERGRQLLPRSLVSMPPQKQMGGLVEALVAGGGEASGVAIAREVLSRYKELDGDGRLAFFKLLAELFRPDYDRIGLAAQRFVAEPGPAAFAHLSKAMESQRQEFFRRLNMAPGATAELVAMRAHLLAALKTAPELSEVDDDLKHLLTSWFNRGFLVLRHIDWSTPANILEKIIAYEAVHAIDGWEDLRRRLDPHDRRCFAFFHPALVDEPIIFVEVALARDVPESIQTLLAEERKDRQSTMTPTTAVFYSISNCQDGLRGISFGNFLIKQVAEDLARELPSLRTFVTLSPAPGFGDWLRRQLGPNATHALTRDERLVLQLLSDPSWADDSEGEDELRDVVMGLAAEYFLVARDARGRQIDPVARFHLGNGARLERINWRGDVSDKGIAESYGIMVNYLYDLKDIERNHEAFANEGTVITSRQVRALVKIASRSAPVPALEAPRGESVSMRADPGVAVRTDGSATRKK